jgi:hypothetical protein
VRERKKTHCAVGRWLEKLVLSRSDQILAEGFDQVLKQKTLLLKLRLKLCQVPRFVPTANSIAPATNLSFAGIFLSLSPPLVLPQQRLKLFPFCLPFFPLRAQKRTTSQLRGNIRSSTANCIQHSTIAFCCCSISSRRTVRRSMRRREKTNKELNRKISSLSPSFASCNKRMEMI